MNNKIARNTVKRTYETRATNNKLFWLNLALLESILTQSASEMALNATTKEEKKQQQIKFLWSKKSGKNWRS